ncbi:exported hypothetical protein [Candidatus Sulfopaludibacter sp. SbA4]|nr:exported hypothetical protein [Candidatus Sulfopaludibacter sp. SbA4]
MNTRLFTLALAVSMVSTASAQNTITVSGPARPEITLATHTPIVAFVTGDLDGAREALNGAVISAGEGKAIGAIAARTLPIPFVGALPVEGALRLLGKLKKPTVKGVNVEYLPGVEAETAIQRGVSSFSIPGQTLQGGSPLLLRLKPSSKDSARIVRGIRVSMKMTGSQINRVTSKVLGTKQDAISCRKEARSGGDVVLTPSRPLEAGEYAVVLVPAQTSQGGVPAGSVWDFRVQ